MPDTELTEKGLYSLIPLEEFKSVLGIDDRDDKLVKFCLATSTLTIESYCKRKLLRKKHFEVIDYTGDLVLPLREYPVTEVLAVSVENPLPCGFSTREFASQTPAKALITTPSVACEILEPDLYCVIPDCGTDNDIPFDISFSPAVERLRFSAIKVIYYSGYVVNPPPCGLTTREFASQTPSRLDTAASMPLVPADLAAACLELASWNFNRYKSKRIGMTGNIRGAGVQGEHFELSMPENVKLLLEPYRRRVL